MPREILVYRTPTEIVKAIIERDSGVHGFFSDEKDRYERILKKYNAKVKAGTPPKRKAPAKPAHIIMYDDTYKKYLDCRHKLCELEFKIRKQRMNNVPLEDLMPLIMERERVKIEFEDMLPPIDQIRYWLPVLDRFDDIQLFKYRLETQTE
jgi:hypothetical protein